MKVMYNLLTIVSVALVIWISSSWVGVVTHTAGKDYSNYNFFFAILANFRFFFAHIFCSFFIYYINNLGKIIQDIYDFSKHKCKFYII